MILLNKQIPLHISDTIQTNSTELLEISQPASSQILTKPADFAKVTLQSPSCTEQGYIAAIDFIDEDQFKVCYLKKLGRPSQCVFPLLVEETWENKEYITALAEQPL